MEIKEIIEKSLCSWVEEDKKNRSFLIITNDKDDENTISTSVGIQGSGKNVLTSIASVINEKTDVKNIIFEAIKLAAVFKVTENLGGNKDE